MPIFDVEANGKQFEIEAPDLQTASAALKTHFGGTQPSAPEYQGSTMADVGKSAVSGLASGLTGLAGLPADALNLATQGVDYLAGTKSHENYGKPAADYAGFEALTKALEGKVGPLYKPQTTAGEFAHTGAEFLPAMLGGPESIATKLATRVAVPAIASETAGQATKGTELEPYARVGGALLGAGGAAKIARGIEERSAASTAIKSAPTAAELDSATSAGYNHPAVKALEIDATKANDLVDNIGGNLKKDRFSEKQAPKTYDALEGLRSPEFGANHTMADFDATRKVLNKIAVDPSTEGEAARRAIRSIDAYTARIPTAHVIAGDAKAASQALFEGRASAAANFRNDRLQQIVDKAQNTAGATHSGGNLENELRKGVRSLINNPKQLRGFSAEEKLALQSFARGSSSSNVLRRIGKLFGGGGGLGQLASSAMGAAVAGPLGMFGAPAIGMAANKLGSAKAMRGLDQISAQVRSRSPLGENIPAPATATPLLTTRQRAMLASLLTQEALPASQVLPFQNYSGR